MFQELQRRIDHAKDLDFGNIFQRSIDLFKETWVQGLLLILISMAVALPLVALIYVPMIAYGIFDPQSFQQGSDVPAGMFVMMGVIYLVVIVVLSAVSFALNASYFRIIKKIDHKEMDERVSFFMYLKGPYLSKSLILSLAVVGISILAMILCFFPLLYVIVPLQFFTLFFAFHPELSVSEIINLSFKLGNKKWFITFGLFIVASILAQMVGLLLCFIGIFVTASFAYLPLYYIYKDVIGFDQAPEPLESNSL